MDDIRSRVAYLQGLAEGLQIDASSAEGRVLSSVIDVLGEFADRIYEMDQDLSAVEEAHFNDCEETIRFIPSADSDEEDFAAFAQEHCGAESTAGEEHTHTE